MEACSILSLICTSRMMNDVDYLLNRAFGHVYDAYFLMFIQILLLFLRIIWTFPIELCKFFIFGIPSWYSKWLRNISSSTQLFFNCRFATLLRGSFWFALISLTYFSYIDFAFGVTANDSSQPNVMEIVLHFLLVASEVRVLMYACKPLHMRGIIGRV